MGIRKRGHKREKPTYSGLRATQPNEYWHVDIIYYRTLGQQRYGDHFLQQSGMTRQIALRDVSFSNSMIEAANKSLKYRSVSFPHAD